jgi:hypothetical protein
VRVDAGGGLSLLRPGGKEVERLYAGA